MDTWKKILFLITKTNWGGAQRYVYDITTNLPRDRFEAVVAGGGDGILFAKLRTAGIHTISVPGLQKDMGIASEWQAFWGIVRLIKKEQPDVVHLNSSKAGALGAVAIFIFRILCFSTTWKRGFQALGNPVSKCKPLVIFTVHGWGFHEDRPWLARAAIFLVSWCSSLFQDKIIVLDRADRAAAEKFIPRRKLALIPNGILEIDFYARADARAFLARKIARPITDNTLLIGAIAELTKNKGLDYFIHAINQLKHPSPKIRNSTIPLIRANKGYSGTENEYMLSCIIGDGEEKETLQRQIDGLGLADTVFLTGFIPDAGRYLMALDIFVLPSLKEGLPYSVMEAMSAGLPVVATQVGGIPDLITDAEDGMLVEPKDANGLAAALTRLMAFPGARSDMSERARQTIKTKFSFSAMMQNTISLYTLYTHDTPPPQ